MRDYGNVTVLPFHGPTHERIEHQASVYDLRRATLRPNHFRTVLLRYGIEIELSPSERGSIMAFTRKGGAALKVRLYFDGSHEILWTGANRFSGVSSNHHGGVPEKFGLHFSGEFNHPPQSYEPIENGGVFIFSEKVERLELRLAASFIDEDTALASANRELATRSLNDLVGEGEKIWNDLLGRIAIVGQSDDQERTFYTCLYRCLLFPRFLDEIDASGQIVHYSPYDGQIHSGSLCADMGFWDTYRTLQPLLAFAYPEKFKQMLEGWLSACRESGWTPKWPSPGLRDCMIGTHFNVVVADAIAKGITDWNVEEAFGYLWRDATEESDNGCYGRQGLNDYVRFGYVPCDRHPHATASTLDYAYDDFCVAQVAKYLGKSVEADMLLKRSQNYRNVFDASVGFMRGRRADGTWEPEFSEFRWGGPFIEGGPWQHTFNVPHDPDGLTALFGGPEKLCAKLDAMLAAPARFETGSYGYEIHEMTEMALAAFGQYAHSNQPVHNFLFLYALAGQPDKTSHWVHRVANELYNPEHLPGDEDNGEMSAWYILASLGLYPFCPGTPHYVKFQPLVARAEINGVPLSQYVP